MLKHIIFTIAAILFIAANFPATGFAQVAEVEVTAEDSTKSEEDDTKTAKKKKKKNKGKDFEDVIEDYEIIEGLFTFYRNKDEGKVYMEIKPEQFDKIYLCNITRESGDGFFFDSGALLFEFPFFFKRVGKNIQFVEKNLRFRADKSAAIRRAVERDIPNSIRGNAKTESEPHPERGSVLVNASELFLKDIGLVGYLTGRIKMSYSLDKKNSYFSEIKAFPLNNEIEVTLHFTSSKPQPLTSLADSRSMFHRYHYRLSQIPESDYKPRAADNRLGHFLTLHQDYTSTLREDPYERYINRWNLQKAEAKFDLSKPKQPIVFWLENTIPVEYRDAIREGVLLWNDAFEKIGIKGAIEVRQMPDDADWDPADIRYNTVRWIVQPGGGYAVGPSRTNPYTGEIYDADIRFSADMVRFLYNEFDELVTPSSWTNANINMFFPGMDDVVSEVFGTPFQLQDEKAFKDSKELSNKIAALAAANFTSPMRSEECRYAEGLRHQMAFGWSYLQSRELANGNSGDLQKYIYDALLSIAAHEVGHTLGLRHNFKASSIHTLSDLQDKNYAQKNGLTGSVMDYTPVNLSVKGQRQGDYYQTTLGPYDYWAIEYAYKPYNPNSKTSETEMLNKIAQRAAEPQLSYATDFDAFGLSLRSIDPNCNLWDLGTEPLEYYRTRFALTQDLWQNLEKNFEKDGQEYNKLRQVFGQGITEYALGGLTVSKYIGGIYHHFDRVGDPNGRLPLEVVPAKKQREALQFLIESFFSPNSFRFSPKLLSKLAPTRDIDFDFTPYRLYRLDYPIHGIVQVLQSIALFRLYDPLLLARIQDNELRTTSGDPFKMPELFDEMRKAIWQEAAAGQNVNSFRRELQRMHLYALDRMVVKSTAFFPHDAVTLARADLVKIKSEIDKSLSNSQFDAYTEAHLQESAAKINAILNAQMERKL